SAPSPHLVVHDDAGNVLFDDNVVLAPRDPELSVLYAVLPIKTVSGDTSKPLLIVLAAVAGPNKQWELQINQIGTQAGQPGHAMTLLPGQTVHGSGSDFSIPQLNGIPLSEAQGIPGMENAALLQLQTDVSGHQYLDLLNMSSQQVSVGIDPSADPSAAAASA